MNKVRMGFIGCGGIANGKHLPAQKRNPAAEIVAFCDIIEERAEKACKEYGVPGAKVYTDYKELLAEVEGIIHRLDGMVQYGGNLFIGIPVKEKPDGSSFKIRQAL